MEFQIYGIYNANGGIVGELKYFIGKITKSQHCELCDITNNLLLPKKLWKQFIDELSVPFTLLHLNEQPSDMAAYTAGKAPCIISKTNNQFSMMLDREELGKCEGNVLRFIELFIFKVSSIEG